MEPQASCGGSCAENDVHNEDLLDDDDESIACGLRAPQVLVVLRRTPGRPPFHPRSMPTERGTTTNRRPLRFPQVPFQHPRSRRATLAPPHFVFEGQHLRRPDCTLSRLPGACLLFLAGGESDRPATQSIATPRPSKNKGWSPPWIGHCLPPATEAPAKAMDASPHPGADGLIQGEPPPNT